MSSSEENATQTTPHSFWPKVIIGVAVIVVGFLYLRSVAHDPGTGTVIGSDTGTATPVEPTTQQAETESVAAESAITTEAQEPTPTDSPVADNKPETDDQNAAVEAQPDETRDPATDAPEPAGKPLTIETPAALTAAKAMASDVADAAKNVVNTFTEKVFRPNTSNIAGDASSNENAPAASPSVAASPPPADAVPAASAEKLEFRPLTAAETPAMDAPPATMATPAPAPTHAVSKPPMPPTAPSSAGVPNDQQQKVLSEYEAMLEAAEAERERVESWRRQRYPQQRPYYPSTPSGYTYGMPPYQYQYQYPYSQTVR